MATVSANPWNRGIYLALKNLMHLIAAVHFWFGIFYDFTYVYPPENHPAYKPITSWGGKFRYLTILGAVCICAKYYIKTLKMKRVKKSILFDLIQLLFLICRFFKRPTSHLHC